MTFSMQLEQIKMICRQEARQFSDAQLFGLLEKLNGSSSLAVDALLDGTATAIINQCGAVVSTENSMEIVDMCSSECDEADLPFIVSHPARSSSAAFAANVKPAAEIVSLIDDDDELDGNENNRLDSNYYGVNDLDFLVQSAVGIDGDDDDDLPLAFSLSNHSVSSKYAKVAAANVSASTFKDIDHSKKQMQKKQVPSLSRRDFIDEDRPLDEQLSKRDLAAVKKQQQKQVTEERTALRQVNKLVVDKKEALKELYLEIDITLDDAILKPVMDHLNANGMSVSIKSMKSPWTVLWKRNCKKTWDVDKQTFVPTLQSYMYEENIVVKLLPARSLVSMIKSSCLMNDVKVLRASHPDKRVLYLVFGLPSYYQRLKSEINRSFQGKSQQIVTEPGRPEIEMELLRLQCSRLCHVMTLEKDESVEEWLLSYSREIAIGPHEKVRYENNMTFAVSDIGPCGKTYSEHWAKMLEQINGITPPIAQAILSSYPTVKSMWDEFADIANARQAVSLLADIPVSRSNKGVANCRRLGPALAEKLFKLLVSNDADLPL